MRIHPNHLAPKALSQEVYTAVFALGQNFLSQGKYEKAIVIFEGFLALFPEDEAVAMAYGEALLLNGQHVYARAHFEKLKERLPLSSKVALGAARAHMVLEDFIKAKTAVAPIIKGEITATLSEQAVARSIWQAKD